ncbi:hypothetical protein L7F22_032776 [Adiantum nelumboides]|nr:hypothetical protein [Adiantum nelumboides]
MLTLSAMPPPPPNQTPKPSPPLLLRLLSPARLAASLPACHLLQRPCLLLRPIPSCSSCSLLPPAAPLLSISNLHVSKPAKCASLAATIARKPLLRGRVLLPQLDLYVRAIKLSVLSLAGDAGPALNAERACPPRVLRASTLTASMASVMYEWSKPLSTSVKILHARVHAQAITLAALAGASAVEYYEHLSGQKAKRYERHF